jgi:hypothetical protein
MKSWNLHLLHSVGDRRPLNISLANGPHGAAVTGVLKLMQWFVMELFTVPGSLRGRPDRGCEFMVDAWRGIWRTPADVQASFTAALVTIKRNRLADETDDLPPEEKFVDATLLEATAQTDSVFLRIRIETEAGEPKIIEQPVKFSSLRGI